MSDEWQPDDIDVVVRRRREVLARLEADAVDSRRLPHEVEDLG